jgi:hypothetical protein
MHTVQEHEPVAPEVLYYIYTTLQSRGKQANHPLGRGNGEMRRVGIGNWALGIGHWELEIISNQQPTTNY